MARPTPKDIADELDRKTNLFGCSFYLFGFAICLLWLGVWAAFEDGLGQLLLAALWASVPATIGLLILEYSQEWKTSKKTIRSITIPLRKFWKKLRQKFPVTINIQIGKENGDTKR